MCLLQTFLRRYSYSAIAFNFFISAFVIVYSILFIGLFQQVRFGVMQFLLTTQAKIDRQKIAE